MTQRPIGNLSAVLLEIHGRKHAAVAVQRLIDDLALQQRPVPLLLPDGTQVESQMALRLHVDLVHTRAELVADVARLQRLAGALLYRQRTH